MTDQERMDAMEAATASAWDALRCGHGMWAVNRMRSAVRWAGMVLGAPVHGEEP